MVFLVSGGGDVCQSRFGRCLRNAKFARDNKQPSFMSKPPQIFGTYNTMSSPKVWGSMLVGVVAMALGSWHCNGDAPPNLASSRQVQDSTIFKKDTPILIDTQAGKTISSKQLPKDVTVEQPKQKKEVNLKPTEQLPVVRKPDHDQSVAAKENEATGPKSGFEMVYVKGGTFAMGDSKGISDICPHKVKVGNFYIGKYEITQADWKAVMGSFPREPGFPNCDQCPREYISWDEIQDFLKKASAKYGKAYRLPTEVEWEYAAKGGNRSKGYAAYSGGKSAGSVAWYSGNSDFKTHPVGEKAANELGLHDMSGNVEEWCQDSYKAYPGCERSRFGKDCRVVRGGAWTCDAACLRPTDRSCYGSNFRPNSIGFRGVHD